MVAEGAPVFLEDGKIRSFVMERELIHPFELDRAAQDTLIERIAALYRWYEPGATLEVMHERFCHHRGTEVDLLVDDGQVVAFAVTVLREIEGERCLFRHGTIVRTDERSRGLYRELMQIALDRHDPDWHACRTQNPRVYEAWQALHGDRLWPHPVNAPSDSAVQIARVLAGETIFDPVTFVVRDVYPYDRSGADYHTCRSSSIREFFHSRLGIHDAQILLARVRPSSS